MVREERLVLDRVLDEARSERSLSRTGWERLHSAFGERFDRAWRLVQEKRIKRYTFRPSGRVVWVAVGQSGEYQVYPNAGYCGCDDFYFRVLDGDAAICYHLLGQTLADALAAYDSIDEDDEAYSLLVGEWRAQARSEGD